MKRRQVLGRFIAASGVVALHGRPPSSGADAPAGQGQAALEAAEAARLAAEEVVRWEFRTIGATGKTLAVGPRPVLRWSNPGVGRIYGSVFLGIADGRPEALFAVYKWYHPYHGFEAEMQSLSLSGLEARRGEAVAWHPERPGVTLQDLPGAPAPAASAAGRLRQLGALAPRFSAHLVIQREGRKPEQQTLRLLPKPIHRYVSTGPDPEPLDGGLFAFVQGTDPELFLLLEARAAGEAAPRWRYGVARMNRDELRAELDGREVWRAPRIDGRDDAGGVYFNMEVPR